MSSNLSRRAKRLSAAGAAALATVFFMATPSCNFNGRAKGKDKLEEAPINVRAQRPVVRPMEEVIEVHGNLEPAQQVDVASEVSGTILGVFVEAGDTVKAGRLLARIDDQEYRLSYQQSLSAYRVARSDYLSTRQLFEQGMKARSELDKMKRAYEDAKSNLEISRLRLRDTEIKSPIKGVVVARNAEVHHQAGAMEVLFTVADLSSFKVPITVTEAEVSKIAVGQKVRVRIDALADDADSFPIEGVVSKIEPRVDPQTGTVGVEVKVPDPGPRARPGMFTRLKIVTAVHKDALVVPRRCLTAEDGNHVWVADKDGARMVQVKTGLIDEQGIEILSGLAPSDVVIVEGHAALTPNSKITIVNNVAESAAAEAAGSDNAGPDKKKAGQK